MNKTIISIEILDSGAKDAIITVKGERNNQTLFEERFDYDHQKKHSLRLHILSEKFHSKYPELGESLGILCIRKLLNDITERSKMQATSDYRERACNKYTIEDYRKLCQKYFPSQTKEVVDNNWEAMKTLPKGTVIRLPEIDGCPIGSFEVY